MKKYLLLFTIACCSLNGALQLTSPAFKHNGKIPARYTCNGDDVSPKLEWTGAPAATKSFALIVEDPDAPGKVWAHWILFNIPPTVNHLPENAVVGQFTTGSNDFHGAQHYNGPCPAHGTHRYNFTLYALDIFPDQFPMATTEPLRAGADKKKLLEVMHDHILDSTTLTGTYERKIKK